MNIIFYATLLVVFLELLLLAEFVFLQFKIKRLVGTGKIRDIEAAANWKTFVSVLLVTIPLVGVYIYF